METEPGERHTETDHAEFADDDLSRVPLWLRKGLVVAVRPLPWGSNYNFIATVEHEGNRYPAIYKPVRGEAPLWDFPDGSLYRRERAAYLVACAIGWRFIPGTAIRNGPYGVGALQVYVAADIKANYFTLRAQHEHVMRRLALFDYITNNADRKAGHCLLGPDNRIWAIDHGLTFHVTPKLRTVIWDFAGHQVPPDLLQSVARLRDEMATSGKLARRMRHLLDSREISAALHRIDQLLADRRFPRPTSEWSIPWPPV